jgi:hypothetical protein
MRGARRQRSEHDHVEMPLEHFAFHTSYHYAFAFGRSRCELRVFRTSGGCLMASRSTSQMAAPKMSRVVADNIAKLELGNSTVSLAELVEASTMPMLGVVRPLEVGTWSVFAQAKTGPKDQGRSYAARDRCLACQSAAKTQ